MVMITLALVPRGRAGEGRVPVRVDGGRRTVWEGVSPNGEVLGAGLEFVILAADGRIATDYQFVE
jgi:hypothetical protein